MTSPHGSTATQRSMDSVSDDARTMRISRSVNDKWGMVASTFLIRFTPYGASR